MTLQSPQCDAGVLVSGDSIVTENGPYESGSKGCEVRTRSVMRLRDGS